MPSPRVTSHLVLRLLLRTRRQQGPWHGVPAGSKLVIIWGLVAWTKHEPCSQSTSRVLTFLVPASLPGQIVRKTADTFDEAHTPASACPRTPSRLSIHCAAASLTLKEVEISCDGTFCRHYDALFLLLLLLHIVTFALTSMASLLTKVT